MSQIPDAPTGARPLGSSYMLDTPIGRGAMGEVWRGRTHSGEPVAVKVLRPELGDDPALVSRFVQERTILVDLVHPNVVHVRDLVVEGRTLAIVMDLVDGGDLRSELQRTGTLSTADACAVMVPVLRGLAAVHAAGVVHRDLKPENILLDRSGPLPVPKLSDFGVSKLVSGAVTSRRTSVIGTPEYMAPELIDDSEPSRASDLYAAGITLYELLCGVTPFLGGSALAVLRKHAEQLPGRPAGVPDQLWAVIDDLVAKDPLRRPGSAALVATALESMIDTLAGIPALPKLDAPPEARPWDEAETMLHRSTPTEVAPRPSRKLPLIAAATVAVLALGGGAAYVLTSGRGTADVVSVTPDSSTASTSPAASATTPAPAPSESTPATAMSESATQTTTPADPSSVVLVDYRGKPFAEVTAALTALGVRYKTQDVVDTNGKDNTVVEQSPAAGQSAGDVVTLSVARAAVATYLADMGALGESPEALPVAISGRQYPHGLRGDMGCSDVDTWEYDLGGDYKVFTAIAGLTDDSSSNMSTSVEVFADDRKVAARTVRLKHPAALKIDVTDVLRLKIVSTGLAACASDPISSYVAFGDPKFLAVSPDPQATPAA